MKSGYKISWTSRASIELKQVFQDIEQKWTERELEKLSQHLEQTIQLIRQNPFLFQASGKRKNIRRAVILSLNSMLS